MESDVLDWDPSFIRGCLSGFPSLPDLTYPRAGLCSWVMAEAEHWVQSYLTLDLDPSSTGFGSLLDCGCGSGLDFGFRFGVPDFGFES